MFNPNTIFIADSQSSFVGLRRNSENRNIEFCLPIGFDEFEQNFEKTKDLFKNTYRTLRKFIRNRKKNIQLDGFDGFIEDTSKGFSLKSIDDVISFQYSKLVYFDSILDAYDDLLIMALHNKTGRSENIDYSQIHKFLHKAIYLENDVIYIDEVESSRKVIQNSVTGLLELFSYIYVEIQIFLDEPINNAQLSVMANNFMDHYLTSCHSLFEEESMSETVGIMKDRLLDIENTTPYKDQDFWHFFDAVEAFLYGELDDENEGNIIWGIDKFSPVWEELCYAYAESTFSKEILYADRSGGSESDNKANKTYRYKNFEPPGIYINPDFKSPFHFELNSTFEKRYIRPDLVVGSPESIYEEQKILVSGRYNNKVLKLKNPSYKSYHKRICSALSFHAQLNEEDKIHFKKAGSFGQIYIKENDISKYMPLLREVEKKILNLEILIIDYKYLSKSIFENPDLLTLKTKIVPDIRKQMIYELALQLNLDARTKSEFWIPTYSPTSYLKSALPSETVCAEIKNASIYVCTLNFLELEKMYLEL